MNQINFPIYLISIVYSINGLLALPTTESTSSVVLPTKTKISTVIQYPINTNLINQYNQHHQHQHNHQYQYYNDINNQPNLGYLIGNCLTKPNITNCVTKLAIDTIEFAITDNNTWDISPYISMVRNSDWHPKLEDNKSKIKNTTTAIHYSENNSVSRSSSTSRSGDDNDLNVILMNKIKDFAESRSIHVSLIPKQISEARSKKGGKDKGGGMVGVMVMVGIMAQMFMGKVLLLAGGAFLISKLALLFSILSGLKKSSGSNDHVIYTESSGGGGGHSSGWSRQLDALGYPGDVMVQRKHF